MDQPNPVRRPRMSGSRRRLIVVGLLVAAFLVGIGIQQINYQRGKDSRDACATTWATDVIDVLDVRVGANDRVTVATRKRDRAERGRDNAVDDVLLLVRALQRQDPPPAPAEQRDRFETALQRFFEAREKLTTRQRALDNVIDRANETKVKNPYPKYTCGG